MSRLFIRRANISFSFATDNFSTQVSFGFSVDSLHLLKGIVHPPKMSTTRLVCYETRINFFMARNAQVTTESKKLNLSLQ